MGLLRKNSSLLIDNEAASALAYAQEGLLYPVTALMNKNEMQDVIKNRVFKGRSLPFPFILAPNGAKNFEVLSQVKKGETLNLLINKNELIGTLVVDEVFKIDPRERLKQIYGTDDLSHPGVGPTFKRLGKLSISGKYQINFSRIKKSKKYIENAKARIGAKHVTSITMAANPLHRAHERIIRLTLDSSDLTVIFLLKPHNDHDLSYATRYKVLTYFINNFLPKDRVIIVPLEHTYIFAGYNEIILDATVAQNYGCDTLLIGKNHAGVGLYYDHNIHKSILDTLKGFTIEIETIHEFVYCNICSTLVSTDSCPHGSHHHVGYYADSILELLQAGVIPPAMLVRKEISALILNELFPNRFKNLEKLFHDILPGSGLLEEHDEQEFYLELMKLYQTSSLN